MPSSLTRDEVTVLVATELEMLDLEAGDTLTPVEANQIRSAIDTHHEYLVEMGKATWEPDEIPRAASDFIAMIIADRVKSKFGKGAYDRGPGGVMGLNAYLMRHADENPTRAKYY